MVLLLTWRQGELHSAQAWHAFDAKWQLLQTRAAGLSMREQSQQGESHSAEHKSMITTGATQLASLPQEHRLRTAKKSKGCSPGNRKGADAGIKPMQMPVPEQGVT